MPGKESLRLQEYYAHPRNLFWKLIFTLFNGEPTSIYSEKSALLLSSRIALWDVCQSCFRPGSLDSNIRDEIPNEIPDLMDNYPSLKKIIFNGKKAEQLYNKYFDQNAEIHYYTCLSTSPANATFTFEQKLNNWKLALL